MKVAELHGMLLGTRILDISTNHSQSFLVGWINIVGWLTLVTTEAIFGGESALHRTKPRTLLTTEALFISAAVVAGSNYTVVLTSWHTYLYFLAISFFAIGLNIFGYRFLGKWNEGACA
jgi:choline transport protein